MNKKAHPKQLWNIAFVLVLTLLTFFLLHNSNKELSWDSLFAYFHAANFQYLIAALACLLLFILLEAISLHLVLRRLGCRPKWCSSLAYSTSDIYYSALTPSATGGQPASAYYMMRDGIFGGTACFALIFNLIAYTASILIVGILVIPFQTSLVCALPLPVLLLVGLGIAMQALLLIFIIASIRRHDTVLRVANALITLLLRIRILKDETKWRNKACRAVDNYRDCSRAFEKQNALFLIVLLLNILQRAALIAISAFVCLAILPHTSFWMLFSMQAIVTLGYNSIPLPGGTGAFEYLYLQTYAFAFSDDITVVIMMVTRVISYYLSLVLCGIYTTAYHIVGAKKEPQSADDPPPAPQSPPTT